MSAAFEFSYAYPFESAISTEGNQSNLRLATFGGAEKSPYFFNGYLAHPKTTADLLLTLSAISRTRFYSPGEIRERLLAAADPVVTCDGTQLRFEVFSVCCGGYARLDLTDTAIDGNWLSKGTTNVDFNPPMRAALSTVFHGDKAGLKIGDHGLELVKATESVTERKVKLPVRWLKSFVEVQSYQTELKLVAEIAPLELAKLLHTLPQQNILKAGSITYLVPSGRSMRLSQRPTPGAVAIGAISRLKILEPILRYAKSVKIYGSASSISAFELLLPQGKFVLVLSPNAARGFSGEGQALSDLVQKVDDSALAKVKAALTWQSKLNVEQVARDTEIAIADVKSALQILGTRGLVGFDISESCYYHRELPFNIDLVEDLHPRIKKARKILADGRVRLNLDNRTTTAYVTGDTLQHVVDLSGEPTCTCPWYIQYDGKRGPCSHIMASEMALLEHKLETDSAT